MADPASLDDNEVLIVDEALRRGASVGQIATLLVERGPSNAPIEPVQPDQIPSGGGVLARERTAEIAVAARRREVLTPLITARAALYERKVDAEFANLKEFVRNGFAPLRDRGETFADSREKYGVMRALYYRAGWVCIKRDVLDRLVQPPPFFGHRVEGGIHELLAPVLVDTEKFVEKTAAAAAKQMRTEKFTVGGFVPRVIAGQPDLSFHAYGLALDIDPDWNPMIKGDRVIAAFNRATGADMGKLLFPASSETALLETYKRFLEAAQRLQRWLRENLAKYDAVQAARAEVRAAKTKAERDAAASRAKPLEAELSKNPDLAALMVLIDPQKGYGEAKVRAWAREGIVTIPPQVIDAFRTAGRRFGARWGGEYQHSKDIMHIEVIPEKTMRRPRNPVPFIDDLLTTVPPPEAQCPPLGPAAAPPR
jgi:hypothetical protein